MPSIKNDKRGVVLLYTVLIGSVLLIVILSIIALMVSELRFSGRIDDSVRAYYAGESGAEYAARWITKGGTAVTCEPLANIDRSSPVGLEPDWSWSIPANGITKEGVGGDSFVRIIVNGVYKETLRRVVVEFTPNCNFSAY